MQLSCRNLFDEADMEGKLARLVRMCKGGMP